MDNVLKAEGDTNSDYIPEGEALMDPGSESEIDEKAAARGSKGVTGVTPWNKKRRTRVFQVAVKDIQSKNTQRILNCGP